MKRHVGKVVRASKGILTNSTDSYKMIPRNILRTTIGRSVDGASIDVYKIGEGKKTILITAGIHGNEVGTVKLANQLINWLHTSTIKADDYTFFIVPCLNPDGFGEARNHPGYWSGGRSGRFNANEVDLNRNFDTPSFVSDAAWNHGKNYSLKTTVFAGKKPFSEPETAAVRDFINDQNVKVWISLHNAGKDVANSNDELARKLAEIFASESGYKLHSESDWQNFKQTGTAKEWCDKQNVTYLEIEGSNRWSSDWPALKTAFEKTIKAI